MTIFGYTIPQIRKAVTTGIGFAIAVLTLFVQGGWGPSNWIAYAIIGIGLLTTALTFILKNSPVTDPVPPVA